MANKSRQVVDRENVGDLYLDLVRSFPLRPIRSDTELDRAISMINTLLDRDDLGPDEHDYLDVLGDLVEKYETEQHPIKPVSESEILHHLMEARDVTSAMLATATGILESTLSEILASKQGLDRDQIAILSRYFQVSPAIFFAD